MNANIAEYHVPVNADIHDIKVIFVDEPDDIINPLGIKGLGATRPTRAREDDVDAEARAARLTSVGEPEALRLGC